MYKLDEHRQTYRSWILSAKNTFILWANNWQTHETTGVTQLDPENNYNYSKQLIMIRSGYLKVVLVLIFQINGL